MSLSQYPRVWTETFVADGLTPVRAYAALRERAEGSASFLLESVVGGERWGRYSILGYRPTRDMFLCPQTLAWRASEDGRSMHPASTDDVLCAHGDLFSVSHFRTRGNPAEKFAFSHVGYLAWDVVHALENVKGWGTDIGTPLARFVSGATIVVFDNLAQTVTIAAESKSAFDRAKRDLEHSPSFRPLPLPTRSLTPSRVDVGTSDDEFKAKVLRAKEFIAAGDAFQIVLARTFSVPSEGRDPFDVYRAMRVLNPSPYMYFLDLPPTPGETSRTQICGASPETMVRLEDSAMTVRPLAGTRRRGKSEAEDEALERELLSDEKERAEHVMLIDLGRNDVGRVAEVGSVALTKRMEIERYSHVMHIVSEVRGRIPSRVAPLDVVRAAFPAGTLSGAPKIRAMQIIRELEEKPRGIYGGAIGYVASTGDLDFAIAIRTAVLRNGVFEVTAGAGIVEASDPASEAEETRSKAGGVLCAIAAAGA